MNKETLSPHINITQYPNDFVSHRWDSKGKKAFIRTTRGPRHSSVTTHRSIHHDTIPGMDTLI